MNDNNQNTDKFNNIEAVKNYTVKILKSPSNWALIIITYLIWSILGLSYSTNQNFDMTVTPQYYVMLLSIVSILSGLLNHTGALAKLAFIGAIAVVASMLAIITSKTGIICFGYPVGYYLLCPMSVFLFLLQIKYITSFSWSKYCEVLKVESQGQ